MFEALPQNAQLKAKLAEAQSNEEKFVICIQYGYIPFVYWYLIRGMDPNTSYVPWASAALFFAAADQILLRILLEFGADPNQSSGVNYETTLHYIARSLTDANKEHSRTSIQLLVLYGADFEKKNKEGLTPVDVIGDSNPFMDSQQKKGLKEWFLTVVKQASPKNMKKEGETNINKTDSGQQIVAKPSFFGTVQSHEPLPEIVLSEEDKSAYQNYQKIREISSYFLARPKHPENLWGSSSLGPLKLAKILYDCPPLPQKREMNFRK